MSDYQSFVKDEDVPPIQQSLSNDDVVMPSSSMVSQGESSALVDASMVAEYDTSDYQGELKEDDVAISDNVDEPQPTNSLPDGWVEGVDEASGTVYYYNTITQESSWTIPVNTSVEENAQQLDPSQNNNTEVASNLEAEPFEVVNSPEENLSHEPIPSEAMPSEEPPFADNSNVQTESLQPAINAGRDIQDAAEQPSGLAYDIIGKEEKTSVPAESGEQLPAGWVEAVDESSGRVYYYNQTSGISSWDKPSIEDVSNPEAREDALTSYPLSDTNQESCVDLTPVEMPSESVPEGGNDLPVEPDGLGNSAGESGDGSGSIANQPEVHPEESLPAEDVPPQEQPLPDGWFEAKDPSGATFYVCQATGESTWERPVGIPASDISKPSTDVDTSRPLETHGGQDLMPDEAIPVNHNISRDVGIHEEIKKTNCDTSTSDLSLAQLPSGWTEIIDPQSGQKYFYNEIMNETSWEIPENTDDITDDNQVEPNTDLPTDAEGVSAPKSVGEMGEIMPLPKEDGDLHAYNFDESSKAQGAEAVSSDAVDNVAALEPAPLMEGWQEATDPATGRTYFFNELTGDTTWEDPRNKKIVGAEEDETTEREIDEYLPQTTIQKEVSEPQAEDGGPLDNALDALPLETKDADKIISGDDSREENEANKNAKLSNDEVDIAMLEVSKPLPAGWQTAVDPTSGEKYYYNDLTGETSWVYPKIAKEESITTDQEVIEQSMPTQHEHIEESGPDELANEVMPEISTGESAAVDSVEEVKKESLNEEKILPAGWVASEDPASGEVFYYNNETGQSQWEPPVHHPTAFREQIVEHEAEKIPTETVQLEDTPITTEKPKRLSASHSDRQNANTDISSGSTVADDKDNNGTQLGSPESPPTSWQAAVDPASGKSYYFNELTGETVWELPVDAKSTVAENDDVPSSTNIDEVDQNTEELSLSGKSTVDPRKELVEAAPKLPTGWLSAIDEASGKIYYYNDEIGETSWEPPKTKVVNEATTANKNTLAPATTSFESKGDRIRPAHALAVFGFGGRLCVMMPQVAKSLSGAALPSSNDGPKTMRRGPIVIHQLRNLIPRDHKYSVHANLRLPMIKSPDQDVKAFLNKKCAETESLVWKVVHLAAQNGGRLKDDFGAVVDLLLSTKGECSNGELKDRCIVPQPPVSSFTDLKEIQSKLVSVVSS